MSASKTLVPSDLTMDKNPMTTAEPSSIDHIDKDTANLIGKAVAEPSQENPSPSETVTADHGDADDGASETPSRPEISATGWLVPPAKTPTSRITFDEYLTLSEITFEWGDSYDCKDWMRLSAILAPTLMVDYTEVNGHKWDSMPAADFVGILSHIGFVGDPLVHTQHHIGASKWEKLSEVEVVGHHQLRAAHQRYTNLNRDVVENKGHGHAMVRLAYRRLEGVGWKLTGLRPAVRWNEFEFDKIFKGF